MPSKCMQVGILESTLSDYNFLICSICKCMSNTKKNDWPIQAIDLDSCMLRSPVERQYKFCFRWPQHAGLYRAIFFRQVS
jgi:hypothetical protein